MSIFNTNNEQNFSKYWCWLALAVFVKNQKVEMVKEI